MENKTLERQNRMLHHLARLPRLMIDIHGRDNVSEFILHELCSAPCFNLRKAAYFVDNPDFNCLHGVAGFADDQAYQDQEIWESPDEFSKYMQNAAFNNHVRSIHYDGLNDAEREQKVLN